MEAALVLRELRLHFEGFSQSTILPSNTPGAPLSQVVHVARDSIFKIIVLKYQCHEILVHDMTDPSVWFGVFFFPGVEPGFVRLTSTKSSGTDVIDITLATTRIF